MSHLIFVYDNPVDPIVSASHETLADAKADLARRTDAIVAYLIHRHFHVKVQVVPYYEENGEAAIIIGRHDTEGTFAWSVERKVGVLA